ncbi:MAG: hypothetical protein IKA95_06240 [Clostridia bacterium]|nr:hypothetical protein [Clostridia bacterium]
MKIFLSSSRSAKKSVFKMVFSLTVVFVCVALFVSQCYFAFVRRSVPASATEIVMDHFSVALYTDSALPKDSVWVCVNGEETALFVDGRAQITLDRPSVIEVMSSCNLPFDVKLTASDSTAVISSSDTITCTKGINYICRCYRLPL